MRIFTALLFAVPFFSAAQAPQVPPKVSFAGMTLTIRDDARREIQKDVDALRQSPKHFNLKADRAKTYFPIIEKIFAEEGVPDDFKYLVLQESSLVADAVSVSNAVGFWQFKDYTAIEMGLRVDKEIDERMNIASSTRAAARYIKKNNTFFNNWIYALQAYQMGAGGVLSSVKESHSGETHAEINAQTYWYVKKFLAYKIAYEGGVSGKGQIELMIYETRNTKTLSELSKEVNVEENELRSYNKWARSGVIPDDRTYALIIPVITGIVLPVTPVLSTPTPLGGELKRIETEKIGIYKSRINGVNAIQALDGENAARFATRTSVDLAAFIKWNEISYSTPLIPGVFYYVGKKRSRGSEPYHKVEKGENLWSVSQKYGVRLKKLKKYNRTTSESAEPGTTLWLTAMKPKSSPEQDFEGNVVEVEQEQSFSWSTTSEDTTASFKTPTTVMVQPEAVAGPKEKLNEDSLKTLQMPKELQVSQYPVAAIDPSPVQVAKSFHTVQPKETLYAIASIYNVGVMDLVRWNNLDLQQGIKPGQVLKLADQEQVLKDVTTRNEVLHEVKVSDTLYSIARKYGVSIKEIMEWNAKKDFSLSVGEKLKVKADDKQN